MERRLREDEEKLKKKTIPAQKTIHVHSVNITPISTKFSS